MGALLLVVFLVGAVSAARARQDPARLHGDVGSVRAQRWFIAVLVALGALLLLSVVV